MAVRRTRFILEGEDRVSGVLGKAERGLTRLGGVAGRAGRSISGLLGTFGGFSGLLGGAAFVGGINNAISKMDEMGKLSQRLAGDLSLTPALSELSHAAELTGVEFRTLSIGLQRLQRRTAEAANGTGAAVGAFDELGISARALVDLPLDQKFEVVADALNGIENPADRVRIAMKLFDAEGVRLIQTMNGGAESIQAMREEARDLGISMTEDAASGAADARDAMTRLQARMSAATIQLATKAAPTIEAIADFIGNDLPVAIDLADKAWRVFLQGIRATAGGIGEGLAELVRGVEKANAKTLEFTGGLANLITIPEGLQGTLQQFADDMEADFIAAMNGGVEITKKFSGSINVAEGQALSYEEILAGLAEENGKLAQSSEDNARATIRSADADRVAAEAARELQRALEQQSEELATLQDQLFPGEARYEKYIENLGILQAAFDRGAISAARFSEAQFALQRQFNDQPLKIAEQADAIEESYVGVFETLSETASRAFGDMLRTGEFSFKRLRAAIIDALADQAIQNILSGIGNLFSGGGGGGVAGALGSLFGGLFADGGTLQQGRWGVVGERGPEIVYAGGGPMTVAPIAPGGAGGGMKVIQNFTINGQADRRTQEQIAASATRGLDRARFRGIAS